MTPLMSQCPSKEALTRLATKRGVLSPAPINEPGTPSDFHTVGGGDKECSRKKGKAVDDSVTKRKQGYGYICGPWALDRGEGTSLGDETRRPPIAHNLVDFALRVSIDIIQTCAVINRIVNPNDPRLPNNIVCRRFEVSHFTRGPPRCVRSLLHRLGWCSSSPDALICTECTSPGFRRRLWTGV